MRFFVSLSCSTWIPLKTPEIILKGYSLPLSTSSTLILAYRSSSHIFASSTSSYIFAIGTTRKCANCLKGGLLTLTSKKNDFIPCDSVAEKRFNKCSNRRNRSKRMHYCIAQVSSGSSRPHVVHTEIAHLAMVQAKMHHRSCT